MFAHNLGHDDQQISLESTNASPLQLLEVFLTMCCWGNNARNTKTYIVIVDVFEATEHVSKLEVCDNMEWLI